MDAPSSPVPIGMILKLYRTKSDIENLSKLRTTVRADKSKNINFRKVVVNKPWGYEYLMFENKNVAIWVLYLKKGASTSMHCHPNKKTSLLVVSGKISFFTLEGEYNMGRGDGLIIGEGVFHSSKSRSKNGSYLLEVESPPIKKDLVRLRDEYGRETQGYEGSDRMSKEISSYEYIDFHEDSDSKVLKSCKLSVFAAGDLTKTSQKLEREMYDLVCLLGGTIIDDNNEVFLSHGEIAHINDLKSSQSLKSLGRLNWLLVNTNGKKNRRSFGSRKGI